MIWLADDQTAVGGHMLRWPIVSWTGISAS